MPRFLKTNRRYVPRAFRIGKRKIFVRAHAALNIADDGNDGKKPYVACVPQEILRETLQQFTLCLLLLQYLIFVYVLLLVFVCVVLRIPPRKGYNASSRA